MITRRNSRLLGIAISMLAVGGVLSQDFSLSWYTIDAGGEMWSSGGDFELSSTIGQPDASTIVMTGGEFELVGGFWVIGRAAVPHVSPDAFERDDSPVEPLGSTPSP